MLYFEKFAFTSKEEKLIGLIVSNMNYAEIGEILSISPKTVENMVYKLTEKIGTSKGRPGLLMHSVRLGLTKMLTMN